METIQYWPVIMENNLKSNNIYLFIIKNNMRQINYF